jgi:hypothetical protein
MQSVCCGFGYAIAVWPDGSSNGRRRSIVSLIVELDGGQHDHNKARDADRTRVLESMGYLVLRFWNHDVMRNMDGVLEEILSTVDQHKSGPPHPTPLPYGEREHT